MMPFVFNGLGALTVLVMLCPAASPLQDDVDKAGLRRKMAGRDEECRAALIEVGTSWQAGLIARDDVVALAAVFASRPRPAKPAEFLKVIRTFQLSPFADAVARYIGDRDGLVNFEALKTAGNLNEPRLIPTIRALMKAADTQWSVRYNCLWAIKDLRARECADDAAGLLADPDSRVRCVALDALAEIGGPKHADAIIARLDTEDGFELGHACQAVGSLGLRPAVPKLSRVIKSRGGITQMCAVGALGQAGGDEAGKILATLLTSTNRDLRRSAASALGELGDPKWIGTWVPLLKDSDANMRRYAVVALGRLGCGEAAENILLLLKDIDQDVCAEAAFALCRSGSGEPLIRETLTLLQDKSPDVRRRELEALGLVPQAIPRQSVAALLDDADVSVRSLAALLLGRSIATSTSESSDEAKLLERLTNLTADKDPDVRAAASIALLYAGRLDAAQQQRLVASRVNLRSEHSSLLGAALVDALSCRHSADAYKRFSTPRETGKGIGTPDELSTFIKGSGLKLPELPLRMRGRVAPGVKFSPQAVLQMLQMPIRESHFEMTYALEGDVIQHTPWYTALERCAQALK